MRNLSVSFLLRNSFAILVLSLASCITSRTYRSSVATDNSAVLMPYNRFIDPAGTVIRFGKPTLENHSLDCALLPGGKVLAIEDRYGLAFIDVQDKKLLFHLDYEGTYKGLMSTYSGIKVLEFENSVHIFWGASNPSAKSSFILDAVWDGRKATISNSISFKGVSPSRMALPNDICISKEGGENYLYVVLNGNSQLTKISHVQGVFC